MNITLLQDKEKSELEKLIKQHNFYLKSEFVVRNKHTKFPKFAGGKIPQVKIQYWAIEIRLNSRRLNLQYPFATEPQMIDIIESMLEDVRRFRSMKTPEEILNDSSASKEELDKEYSTLKNFVFRIEKFFDVYLDDFLEAI